MLRHFFSLAGRVLAVSFFLVAFQMDGHAEEQGHHIKVSGAVSRVKSGEITLKTQVGTITLNVNAAQRLGFAHVKVGDELTVWVNEDNMVVDVHGKGASQNHRVITGKLAFVNAEKTEVKLWTPEGVKNIPVKVEKERLSSIPEGTIVTVELDEAGRLSDIHKSSNKGKN